MKHTLSLPEQIEAIPPKEIPLMGVALILDEWRRGNGYGAFSRIPREIVDNEGGCYNVGRKDVEGQMPIITLTYSAGHSKRNSNFTALGNTEMELGSLIKKTNDLKRYAWELASKSGNDPEKVASAQKLADDNKERIEFLEEESKRIRAELEKNDEIVWEFPISLEGHKRCLSIL